jgi:hypothetical protein
MALPNEQTGFTYGWSPNDFVQNFLAEGDDDRGGADKGENEGALSILTGDVVALGTNFREVKVYAAGDMTVEPIGVALSDAKDGEMVPISCGPIVKSECAESITRGNRIGPDDGEAGLIKPYTPTGGGTIQGAIGIALNDGDDGDIIPVLMKIGFSFIG